jgi:heme/copper-type cytochrome/quinol oxidase subunit 2
MGKPFNFNFFNILMLNNQNTIDHITDSSADLSSLSFVPVTDYQMGFQDPASPVAEGISAFHNDLRIIVRFILSFVVSVLHYCIVNFNADAVVLKTNSKAGIDINTKT